MKHTIENILKDVAKEHPLPYPQAIALLQAILYILLQEEKTDDRTNE